MVSDQPVVNYNTKKGDKRSMFGTKEEYDEMEALADAWKKQNGSGMAGKTVKLDEFLQKKV